MSDRFQRLVLIILVTWYLWGTPVNHPGATLVLSKCKWSHLPFNDVCWWFIAIEPIPSSQRDVKQWTYQNHFFKLYKTKYRIISRGRRGGCNYGLDELLHTLLQAGRRSKRNALGWSKRTLNSPTRLEVFKTGSPHSFTPRQSKLYQLMEVSNTLSGGQTSASLLHAMRWSKQTIKTSTSH